MEKPNEQAISVCKTILIFLDRIFDIGIILLQFFCVGSCDFMIMANITVLMCGE
jgi:hypothetical protein